MFDLAHELTPRLLKVPGEAMHEHDRGVNRDYRNRGRQNALQSSDSQPDGLMGSIRSTHRCLLSWELNAMMPSPATAVDNVGSRPK